MTNYGSNTNCTFKLYSNGVLFPYNGALTLYPKPGGSWAEVYWTKPAGSSAHGVGYVLYPGGKAVECGFHYTLV